jgi:hypothetical protein
LLYLFVISSIYLKSDCPREATGSGLDIKH